MTDYLFVADYFSDEVTGGGELNNKNVIKELQKNHKVVRIKSEQVKDLTSFNGYKIIIANFINLSEKIKEELTKRKNYVIYEHDHKYLKSRNPATYKNYLAPKTQIVNEEFYRCANSVFCQSKLHKQIMSKNLNLNNIVNLSGNLWNESLQDLMMTYSDNKKKNRVAIMLTDNWHKNTKGAVEYCKKNGLQYELLLPEKHKFFLENMSKNQSFIFLPKTPETLSRIAVEARMMNLSLITNSNLGATSEEWFALKGKSLINYVFGKMRLEIMEKIKKGFQ